MSGGDLVARELERQGVRFVFTLCGGHVSPILVGAKHCGLTVVDVRHEATAVFAADATARLTGVPGVAVVTAGPGVTNTITALKNAQLAQSPLVLFGGATATVLKGRGALQDIDQRPLVKPHVKAAFFVERIRDLPRAVVDAFAVARSGVPGPVFVECPVDLLYPEAMVRSWYAAKTDRPARNLAEALQKRYLAWHLDRTFKSPRRERDIERAAVPPVAPSSGQVRKAATLLSKAKRPLLILGSQAMSEPQAAEEVAAAVVRLGVPVYLGGMARGLLGQASRLQLRHERRSALKEADLVLLAGFPSDFRLDYGSHVRGKTVIAVNRSAHDLRLNLRPTLGVLADPGLFLVALAEAAGGEPERFGSWLAELTGRDQAREAKIAADAASAPAGQGVNPLALCRAIEAGLPDASVLVADGGDFVATASYVVRPRAPLCWLDPGAFGTLGVGAGFALAAQLCRPGSEVWLLWGDGAAGLSLADFDTFARHRLPVIAVVGNDASWAQIAREQVEMLGDAVGTELARSDYHVAAQGLGGEGLLLTRPDQVEATLAEARRLAAGGRPVLINAHLAKTDFRKGSLSM
ncbi:MAG TPA: thiamine pyrophosphate-binding protein [Thermoanaerobaculia bacterium]|nr:thiamine pyrophosphate-binding protein [Thermoanaerobaculia bacterium]